VTTAHRVSRWLGYIGIFLLILYFGQRSEAAKDSADRANANRIEQTQAQLDAIKAVNHRQDSAVKALCRFTADLRQRKNAGAVKLARSRKFLRDNPQGIPGIPRSLIEQGIQDDERTLEGQHRTLKALNGPLHCNRR
jgi:hypothetical protein